MLSILIFCSLIPCMYSAYDWDVVDSSPNMVSYFSYQKIKIVSRTIRRLSKVDSIVLAWLAYRVSIFTYKFL